MTSRRFNRPTELIAAAQELEREATVFIERFRAVRASERATAKREGTALASHLRTKAIDLCHNKATEVSPEIERLFELAAKVALLAQWPDEEALAQFERDVGHVHGNSERNTKHARN
jgi:hypothetical protein